jgi:hypothetical protein
MPTRRTFTVREKLPQQASLFTYATGISLSTPARHRSRLPILFVLLLTAGLAALVFAAAIWFATADFSALFGVARDLLLAALPNA